MIQQSVVVNINVKNSQKTPFNVNLFHNIGTRPAELGEDGAIDTCPRGHEHAAQNAALQIEDHQVAVGGAYAGNQRKHSRRTGGFLNGARGLYRRARRAGYST